MRRIAIVFIVLFSIPSLAAALDVSSRSVGPVMTWNADMLDRYDSSWLHVKFVEGSRVRLDGARLHDDSGLDLSSLDATLAGAQVMEIRRTFDGDPVALRALKQTAEARSGVVGPDLSLWFDIRVAGGRTEVARLINELNALDAVEIAHPAPVVENAVIDPPTHVAPAAAEAPVATAQRDGLRSPNFVSRQGYLNAAPVGLNAAAAWNVPGGHGEGQHFCDVELCWTIDHEDFNIANNFYVGGATQDPSYETHGTAVLGEILGQINTYGINGFSPAVQYGVVAVTIAEWPNVPHYFQEAIDHLSTGDVWLIELQMYPPGKSATPMEWLQVNYDVIWTGCWGRGIVCIEAGANGSQNLDDASWGGVFDRNVRDSGAIMCAAGTPNGLVAEYFTNYGSRMDVHAWGSTITTTGYGDLYNGGTLQTRYTATFSGTSGASPMATGAANCLQGVARANLGAPLDPIRLRSIMHDTGTPYNGTQIIGPRPNLAAAVPAVLAITSAEESGVGSKFLAWPNPSHSGSEIRLAMPSTSSGALAVFDASGRLVRRIAPIGSPVWIWDGRDEAGREIGAGVYFYRTDAGAIQNTGRIIRLK
jgi:serine protease